MSTISINRKKITNQKLINEFVAVRGFIEEMATVALQNLDHEGRFLVAARRAVLMHATGKTIARLDDDTILSDETIELIVDEFRTIIRDERRRRAEFKAQDAKKN